MKVIGLTGNIAVGKSAVSRVLKELGAFIIDADRVAREIVEPYKPVWQDIVKNFGKDILLPDQNINRRKLGEIVFNDPEALKKLNSITHPSIIRVIKGQLEDLRRNPQMADKVVVLDAPLLFEAGMEEMVDEVWVVAVDRETQLKRLMERNGYTREEALKRIRSQIPLEKKTALADRVIDNSGSLRETEEIVRKLWNKIKLPT